MFPIINISIVTILLLNSSFIVHALNIPHENKEVNVDKRGFLSGFVSDFSQNYELNDNLDLDDKLEGRKRSVNSFKDNDPITAASSSPLKIPNRKGSSGSDTSFQYISSVDFASSASSSRRPEYIFNDVATDFGTSPYTEINFADYYSENQGNNKALVSSIIKTYEDKLSLSSELHNSVGSDGSFKRPMYFDKRFNHLSNPPKRQKPLSSPDETSSLHRFIVDISNARVDGRSSLFGNLEGNPESFSDSESVNDNHNVVYDFDIGVPKNDDTLFDMDISIEFPIIHHNEDEDDQYSTEGIYDADALNDKDELIMEVSYGGLPELFALETDDSIYNADDSESDDEFSHSITYNAVDSSNIAAVNADSFLHVSNENFGRVITNRDNVFKNENEYHFYVNVVANHPIRPNGWVWFSSNIGNLYRTILNLPLFRNQQELKQLMIPIDNNVSSDETSTDNDIVSKLEPSMYGSQSKLKLKDDSNLITFQGVKYDSMESFKAMYSGLPWMTYRSGPWSDSGWGCMHRAGQMLLATTLFKHHGINPNGLKLGSEEFIENPEKRSKYIEIMKMFLDSPWSRFSLQNIATVGNLDGVNIGNWFSPTNIARALQYLSVNDIKRRTKALFPVLSKIIDIERNEQEPTEGNNPYTKLSIRNTGVIEENSSLNPDYIGLQIYIARDREIDSFTINFDSPTLILIPVTLGIDHISSYYHDTILYAVSSKFSVGMIGGKPNSALYFVGNKGDRKLIYLDPHIPHTRISKLDSEPSEDNYFNEPVEENLSSVNYDMEDFKTYHEEEIRTLKLKNLDPSVMMAFYVRNREEYNELLDEFEVNKVIDKIVTIRS